MNKTLKNFLIVVGVVGAFALLCVILSMTKKEDFHEKYEGKDLSVYIEGIERTGTYKQYLEAHKDAKRPAKSVEVDLYKYTSEGDVYVSTEIEGASKALVTDNGSTVNWTVNIPETGMYNVIMDYMVLESKGVAAERQFMINGKFPFDDSRNLSFARVWTDGGEVKVDNQGNEIRPTQVESYEWQTSYFKDELGYTVEPYKFYFEAGNNTITLYSENEPVAIKGLRLLPVQELPSYSEYVASQPSVNMSENAKKAEIVVQGESSTKRSESSLYAKYDRGSATTRPNSVTNTVLNYIGGDAWRTSGQWIEWEFEVPEDGYYNIMIKGRQNYRRGSVSNRIIYIDGEIPFKDMQEISFEFSNDWLCKDLADSDGNAYEFYLKQGKHTIRLEATLGGLGPIISDLEDSTFRLNEIYRKILVYTGASPDKYRDYKIDKVYPQYMQALELEEMRLFKIVDDMTEYSGQKADLIANAQTVAQQIERFIAKPQKIPVEFVVFKDNLTSLGTASLNLSETKLDIDYITISGCDAKVKNDTANFFQSAWHEIKSFVASFFVDYNSVGDIYDAKTQKVVKVWVLTGRDQGTILKTMIDDDFIPKTGIPVNVEVIDAGALLNAVLAGTGPNVVLSVGANQPVNYALRGAAEDITQFEGWEEVLSHYSESSYEQYRLDGKVYGIPEQQTFSVMFYRKDILEELELDVPQTWKELIEMLPTIQGNNLSVGLPSAAGSSSTGTASTAIMSNMPDLSMYFSLLYQYGGDMYTPDGRRTTVDTEAGIKAFDDYIRYFNDYGLPVIYDFVTRFRSGEMPIGIAAYSTYNTLMVSAPEIRGLWDFTLIPGTEYVDENGNSYIDRSDFITGNATMMIAEEDEQLKLNSWEFMKWWSNADTQVRFGREIEALLGSSARYATANRDAFASLSWSVDDIAVLNEQWNQTVGIREVPGGYYTGRHISNAIRKVINEKVDSRETIIDYSIKIDEEIIKKRKEFGMEVSED